MAFNQRELRAAFWRDHPTLSRDLITDHAGTGKMHRIDTRMAWVDYVDAMQRSGEISESLAQRATLQPARYEFEFEIQGYFCGAWECANTETTRRDARRSLREYRENDPTHSYRIQRRRVIVAQGE